MHTEIINPFPLSPKDFRLIFEPAVEDCVMDQCLIRFKPKNEKPASSPTVKGGDLRTGSKVGHGIDTDVYKNGNPFIHVKVLPGLKGHGINAW